VWDVDREAARRRMIRALAEYDIEGITTLIPFHLWLMAQQEFIDGGALHDQLDAMADAPTRLDGDREEPVGGVAPAAEQDEDERVERRVTAEVNGRRFDVTLFMDASAVGPVAGARKKRAKKSAAQSVGAAGGDTVTSPMQGTIFKVPVEVGQEVAEGDVLVIVEAMKMENEVMAHQSGVVKVLHVAEGDSVTAGQPLVDVVAAAEE